MLFVTIVFFIRNNYIETNNGNNKRERKNISMKKLNKDQDAPRSQMGSQFSLMIGTTD